MVIIITQGLISFLKTTNLLPKGFFVAPLTSRLYDGDGCNAADMRLLGVISRMPIENDQSVVMLLNPLHIDKCFNSIAQYRTCHNIIGHVDIRHAILINRTWYE
jgi:hypothetical protein